MISLCKPIASIRMDELFDGRLEVHGIREVLVPARTKFDYRCLRDDSSFIWVVGYPHVEWIEYGRRMLNYHIFKCILTEFDTDCYGEYDPELFGYGSREEMIAASEADAHVKEAKYLGDIMKYVLGEESEIEPHIRDGLHAKIGRLFVATFPDLAAPERREKLLAAIAELDGMLKGDRQGFDDSVGF